MKYRNAKAVLPEQLLKELQMYIQGEIIYVPGSDATRVGWGENNGTREKYEMRNTEIIMLYQNGMSKESIANRYHLSEHSIKKIIHDSRNKMREPLLAR